MMSEPPDDTGQVVSPAGNGQDLLESLHGPGVHVTRPPTVFQGSSDLTVHADVADYVSTPALEEADDRLQDCGWVVLCGPPGSGKTTLANALCRISRKRDQYAVYVLEKVHLWKSHVGERDQSVVLLDDNFGRCYLNDGQYWDWRMIFKTILEMVKIGGIRLVITVYPHILHELQRMESRSDSFFKHDSGVVWLTGTLSLQVRENMLNFHLSKLQREEDVRRKIVETVLQKDESGAVFPWCCAQMVMQWSSVEDPTSVFVVPAEAHVALFKDMVLDKPYGPIFVALLVLTMKGLSNFLHNRGEGRSILKELDMPEIDADTLTRYGDILHGKQSVLFQGTFTSRVLYEAVGLALGRYFRLPTLLRVCDAHFLVKYVHFTLIQAVPCVTVGDVPGCSIDPRSCTSDQQALVERIYTEVIEGNPQIIFQHPSLQCPVFLQKLNQYCAKDNKMMKQLLNAKDSQHQLPLVYWSAFLPSPTLTQWCLDKMQMVGQLPLVALMACSLSDHVAQISPCRLQSLLSERLSTNRFEHQSCTMDFPFPDQCLSKEIQHLMEILCTAESVQNRLHYLINPSLAFPPDLITVQVSKERLKLQVKDKRLWYLVFRLLTDREVQKTDKHGNSILHVAVKNGERGVVELLLEAGADITQKNRKGATPYQMTQHARAQAAQKRSLSGTDGIFGRFREADKPEAQLLLLYEIDVNQKNSEGKTLLSLMYHKGHRDYADIISLLIQVGAVVKTRTERISVSFGLLWAARNGPISTVEVLLQHGAHVNDQDTYGFTPMMLAARNGHTSTVEVLLQHGAHVSAQTEDGITSLLLAASQGHRETVQLLLQHGAPVNEQHKYGLTPMMFAAENGHTSTVKLLLQHGADVNEQHKYGLTPVMLAAENGHTSTVKVLLQHGADVNEQYGYGLTPMMLAAENGHTSTVKVLLQHGADVNTRTEDGMTPLLLAAENGHTITVKLLLQHGADVNARAEDGITPLLLAARNGHTSTVELLLQHGADVNARTEDGITPLLLAAQNGHTPTVELLLQHGADVNARTEDGITPLLLAAKNGHTPTVELLLQHGADVNARNEVGITAPLIAAQNGHTATVELLLQHGADVNARNEIGITAPLIAAQNGHTPTVKLLLQHGADVNARTEDGITALLLAAENGHTPTVKLLLQHGADVNARAEDGSTPLMLAAENDHTPTVKLLLQHGADVNARAEDGNTPLMLAASQGHHQTIQLLLQHGASFDCVYKYGFTQMMLAAKKGLTSIV